MRPRKHGAGATDFATDDEMIAHIRHPEVRKPGVKMPTWDGVIAEADYAPLASSTRRLGGLSQTPAPEESGR